MDQPVAMRVLERARHLERDRARFVGRQSAIRPRRQMPGEIAAGHVLTDDVEAPAFVEDVVHGDDPGMVAELRHGLGFALQAGPTGLVEHDRLDLGQRRRRDRGGCREPGRPSCWRPHRAGGRCDSDRPRSIRAPEPAVGAGRDQSRFLRRGSRREAHASIWAGAPQPLQKRASGSKARPHPAQVRTRRVPQPAQNAASPALSRTHMRGTDLHMKVSTS